MDNPTLKIVERHRRLFTRETKKHATNRSDPQSLLLTGKKTGIVVQRTF